jgi:hypothetical protein
MLILRVPILEKQMSSNLKFPLSKTNRQRAIDKHFSLSVFQWDHHEIRLGSVSHPTEYRFVPRV